MEKKRNESTNTRTSGSIELKWWEKKKGMTLEDKKRKLQGKQDRKARREQERMAGAEEADGDEEPRRKAPRKAAKGRPDREERAPRTGRHTDEALLATDRGNLFANSTLDDLAVKAIGDFEKPTSGRTAAWAT